MSLYAIGDLHLSLASDKPMDVFGGRWCGYIDKLRDGFSQIESDDTTVICGDLSWALSLEESLEDFRFIDSLPGKKVILKGNHDYWFSTAAKLKGFFEKNNITTIEMLHNNCIFYNDIALCGTRGWFFEENMTAGHDEKIFKREMGRLETSLKCAKDAEKLCFLHYPPKYDNYLCPEIFELLKKYDVKRCFYGHLHGEAHRHALVGKHDDVYFELVSADYLNFKPIKIC